MHEKDRHMAQKTPTVYEFIPKLGRLRDDVPFGDVWEHPDLSKRDRSLITVAMLADSIGPTRFGATCRGRSTTGDGDRVEGTDHARRVLCRWPCTVTRAAVAIVVFGPT